MASPNEQEQLLICQFREQIDYLHIPEKQRRDHVLLRWIRTADHDLQKAEEMLGKSLNWRAQNDVDSLLNAEWHPWVFFKFPFWIDGVDKLGHPVAEIPLGIWELSLLSSDPQMALEFDRYSIFQCEKMMEAVEAANLSNPNRPSPITQWTLILDCKGYPVSKILDAEQLRIQLRFAELYENHYPESAYKVYYINIPPCFPLYITMFKKCLRPQTFAKFSFYGNHEEWKPILLEEIGKENLGYMYGGRKTRMAGDHVFSYDKYIK